IGTRNVTRAQFRLAWTDDVGDPDTFRVAVTSPQGVSKSAEGSDGRLVVVFDALAPPPSDARMLAASAQEAQQRAAASDGSDAAESASRFVEAGEGDCGAFSAWLNVNRCRLGDHKHSYSLGPRAAPRDTAEAHLPGVRAPAVARAGAHPCPSRRRAPRARRHG